MTKYCLYFNGTNNYIAVNGNLFDIHSDFSVETLVYLDDESVDRGIWNIYVDNGDIRTSYHHTGGPVVEARTPEKYTAGIRGFPFEAGKWYFWVVVFKIGEFKVETYRNGVFWKEGAIDSAKWDSLGNMTKIVIGVGYFCYKWNGFIGLVRVYNRALSQSEIEQNFESPWDPVLDGLVLWLNFEEGCGDRVYDKSGNGNDGVVYGGARWLLFPGVGRWGRVWVDGLEVPCASSADFVRETSVEKLNELMFPKLQEKYFELTGLFDLSNPDHVYALAFLKNKLGRKVEVKFDNHMWITAYLKTITEQPTTQGKLKTTLKLLW